MSVVSVIETRQHKPDEHEQLPRFRSRRAVDTQHRGDGKG